MYYDSLMQGKGLIKRSKQIQIVGQSAYLIVAVVLILLRFNLIAIVSAQALSIIIRRVLSYRMIYTVEFKKLIKNVKSKGKREFIKPILPNAIKLGLTFLGSFLITRASIVIGSLFLSLDDIASYGITIQIIAIIASIASIYFTTYQPKIVQCRVQNDNVTIKHIYLKGCALQLCTFVVGGLALVFLGEWVLIVIGSKTPLLSKSLIVLALLVSLLETNHGNAASMLLTKNEVPFFKPSLISGACVVIGLIFMLKYSELGVITLILVPLLVDISYQSWKWPLEVIKDLKF
jgi:O-antigen/teichoic acid export membrane protein